MLAVGSASSIATEEELPARAEGFHQQVGSPHDSRGASSHRASLGLRGVAEPSIDVIQWAVRIGGR
jgi:hypothetical protein